MRRKPVWMLLVALSFVSLLTACTVSVAGGIAGLFSSLALLVALLFGLGTQAGCDNVGPCLSIGPCLTLDRGVGDAAKDGNASDAGVDQAPTPDAEMGVCLAPPMDAGEFGPCLKVAPDMQLDGPMGPCLSMPADMGASASLQSDPAVNTVGASSANRRRRLSGLASASEPRTAHPSTPIGTVARERERAISHLADRLAPDVRDRLKRGGRSSS